MLGGSDSKAHSIFEGRMVVVEAHTCNNGDDIPRQQNGNRLKAHLKLCLQGQQQPNLKGTRLLMYINSAAVATALIFLIYALLRMPGQQHAPQEPCKTTLPRGQQAAKVEFAVRDASRMQCLQEVNDALMDVTAPFFNKLKRRDGVALYDVVLHRNLGDSFLWAGSSLLSTKFHRPPKYICAIHQKGGWDVIDDLEFPMCNDETMLEAIGPNGLVLLHPGGNFGDLWRKVHMGRMLDLQRWAAGYGKVHNWTVVQLPQSIHYEKKTNIEADKAILASLPRGMFHLMVRTTKSMKFARWHFNTTPVHASPDTAFAIGSWFGSKPSVDVLALLRGDHETQAMEENVTTEWLQHKFQQHNLTVAKEDWYYPYHKSQEATKVAITQISLSRVAAGAEQLAKGRVVITNRLHAAIMANFVGRPLIWIDTKQKKVNGTRGMTFSFSPACTEQNMHSKPVANIQEAVDTAIDWLTSPSFAWTAAT